MDKELASERRLAFGEELRKAREARGISLEGLALETRIRLDFVQALETGAFEKLPGEVFGRGFVRSIGRTLAVETDGLIALFDEAWGPSAPPQSVLKVEIKNKPTRIAGENLKVKWANIASILKRGLGLHTVLPLSAVVLSLGLASWGIWRGSSYFFGQIRKWTASEQRQEKTVIPETSLARSGNTTSTLEPSLPLAQMASEQVGNLSQSSLLSSGGHSTQDGGATHPSEQAADNLNTGIQVKAQGPSGAGLAGKPLTHSGEPFAAAGLAPEFGEPRVLELVVSEPVRIKLEADQQPPVLKELTPDTYRFTFGSKAELMVYDAAALKVLFNGKPLGSLGNKGRIRRLSFQADGLKAEKKL